MSSSETIYDVLIIGGGIQGAGVARDAALRGLSVMLCEKEDFSHATSSQSSKLIHGGLRYLERLELGLVHESLRERSILIQTAKHMVRPLSLALPVFKESRRPAWMYKLGLMLYDFLAWGNPLPKHESLSQAQVEEAFPFLNTETLDQTLAYSDGQTDDFRLTLLNLIDAKRNGALCKNYTKVVGIERRNNFVFNVSIKEHEKTQVIQAKTIVNAGGPWIDQIINETLEKDDHRVAHGKGIHLVFESERIPDRALFLEIPDESRIFFVLPWKGKILVGTTDTVYEDSLENIRADEVDVQYLLNALNTYLKPDEIKKWKLVGTMAGVRPLVFKNNKSTKELSRGYRIEERYKNIWNIEGGKYTVYRKIGELVTDELCSRLRIKKKCKTHERSLPGSPPNDWKSFVHREIQRCQQIAGIDRDMAEHWVRTYGDEWEKLLTVKPKNQSVERLHENYTLSDVEVRYLVAQEFAQTLEDLLVRRSFLFYSESGGRELLDSLIIVLMDESLGSSSELEEQRKRYIEKLESRDAFLASFSLA